MLKICCNKCHSHLELEKLETGFSMVSLDEHSKKCQWQSFVLLDKNFNEVKDVLLGIVFYTTFGNGLDYAPKDFNILNYA